MKKTPANQINRRNFIKASASIATISALTSSTTYGYGEEEHNHTKSDKWGPLLPTRTLGRTNLQVSMLGVGGFHVGNADENEAESIIETAIEGGIRFFDTAESYQRGESEARYGKYLVPKYRDDVFIMSKSQAKDAKTAEKHLDETLRRLKCDYMDLWQIHSLKGPEDVDSRLSNGVLDVFLKAKSSGKVKYIGFTGHSNPEALLRILEKTSGIDPFDTCQMPVNAIDPSHHSFINQVMPVLEKKNIGILAMKTLADGRFFALKKRKRILWTTDDPLIPNQLSVRDAIHFAWSYPISVLITGADNSSLLREKIDFAKTYVKMSQDEKAEIIAKASIYKDKNIEYFKTPIS